MFYSQQIAGLTGRASVKEAVVNVVVIELRKY